MYGSKINIAQVGAAIKKQQDAAKAEAARKEADRVAALKANGQNADGSYVKPTWSGISNPNGTLQSQYTLGDWQNVNPDTAALDQYKQTAMRGAGELSPWAKSMMDKMKIDQAANMDKVAGQAANAQLSAQSQLAQSGGLSGAARERMARTTSRDALLGRQNVARQGQLDQYNLQANDESQRMSQLQTLQGMNNTQADAQFKNSQMQMDVNKYNLGNQLNEVTNKRQYELDTWKTNQQTWAANKTADAQAKAARSGGGKK